MSGKKLFKLDTDEDVQESWDTFTDQENKSRDLIIFKKNYVDLTNDLIAGLLLHQIVFWFLPSKDGNSKLRVFKNGEQWLAKARTDWWDEIRISPKQYDRAMATLKDAYIVDVKLFKFNGTPMIHIKLNRKILLGLLDGNEIRSRITDEAEAKIKLEEEKRLRELKEAELNKNSQRGNPISTEGENPFTPKVKIHLPQRSKSIKHRLLHRLHTEHSKECSCNSCRVAEKDGKEINQDIGNPEAQAEPKPNEDNNIGSQQPAAGSKTDILRAKSKTVKQEKKPKKEFELCPLEFEPFMEAFEKYTGRHFRGTSQAYENSWNAIADAINGDFFNIGNTPSVDEKYYGCKLDMDEWIMVLERFALMRNNADYFPKNKASIKSITPNTFLYNGFSPFENNKSYFITCLENEPKLLAPKLKDPDPNITNFVIEEVQKRYGWDLSNGGRNTAIRCTKKLTQFFADNKDRMPLYDIHYSLVPQKVGILLEALEKNEYADHPMEPMYLYGDLTYSKFLPKHLKYVGSMND